MDLFLDLDSRQFLQSAAYPAPLHHLNLKRGDVETFLLHFVRDGRIVPATAAGIGLEVVGAGFESVNGTYTRTAIANGRYTYTKTPHTFLWVPAGEQQTRNMVVSGAGESQLNGTYSRLGRSNGKPLYGKGDILLQWIPESTDGDPPTTTPGHWSLHNRAYYSEGNSMIPGHVGPQNWQVGTGIEPAPRVTPEMWFRPGHWGLTINDGARRPRRKAYQSLEDTAFPHQAGSWTPRAGASPAPRVFPTREPLAGIAGLKLHNAFEADFLSVADSWTPQHDPPGFAFSLRLDTPAIHAAFSSHNLPQLAAMLEIEWRTGDLVSSSRTLPVTIHNDMIRGDEASLGVDTTPPV